MKLRIPKKSPHSTSESPAPRFLIAVSGGVDSMVLLHLIARKLSKSQIAVAHFNHRTRGLESEKDAALVKEITEEMGLSFFTANRQQIGAASELELRKQRREFLEDVALKHGFDFICMAHHSNDQLETLLMRLLRGTDWRGMGAIRYRQGKWLRPILNSSKEDIERYAKKHRIAFRTDGSNYQTKYLRNSIRHGVAQEFLQVAENSGISRQAALDNISHWCLRAQEVHDFLQAHTSDLLRKVITETVFWVRIPLQAWENIPRALQPFFLNTLTERYLKKTLCRKQLKLWRQNLEKKQKRFDLKEGIHVRVSHGHWYLMLGEGEPQTMPNRGPTPFTVQFPDAKTEISLKSQETLYEARYFRAGDRFQTNGKKLKEIFQRNQVPAPERKLIPVLAHPGTNKILWYLGSDESKTPAKTNHCNFPFA